MSGFAVHGSFSRASTISSNDFRPGVALELDNAPWRVQEFLHVKPGKGAAFVRTKLKNYITGNVVDRTFRGGETVQQAELEKKETQFTYVDGDDYVFMDNTTYEETRLKKDESWSKYLKEGAEVALLVWNGRVISVDSPSTVELEVADTDPGLKGNTAAGGSKPATLETGAVIQVPLFIIQGEKILVDTRTDTYLGRGSKS
ncbi:organellar elongation factor P [Coccomyxa subellipsoidea C-169]|uniref:Organellar elongation factor P n=1 Tax=Coccomyxa subellipsoidea (strain C-169) TaxID=574566 RepID=I0Z6P7_COCSC|nr:organellar elongation factor P [Coccomyxa subellipsoidea C-169]EIE26316.1 organellar elongation factor P [Coccomyxa subellipsoidea C-169]|eukprot:XP_005650860.1 organellar elongation factor P [Coccomyxa subellipsoidea C-169]